MAADTGLKYEKGWTKRKVVSKMRAKRVSEALSAFIGSIVEMRDAGLPKSEIRARIEAEIGMAVNKSTFNGFWKRHIDGAVRNGEESGGQASPEGGQEGGQAERSDGNDRQDDAKEPEEEDRIVTPEGEPDERSREASDEADAEEGEETVYPDGAVEKPKLRIPILSAIIDLFRGRKDG